MKMEDDGGGDEKIIAVPSTKLTQRYVHVQNHTDLPRITPVRSRRSSRPCTVVRERPTRRARSAVLARAFSRRVTRRAWSISSNSISSVSSGGTP
jgi:hypothetical protein